jgi:predicted nucleotidyltransferase
MPDLTTDMLELLDLLDRYEVEYLICGGHAVAFYGYVRMTMNLDILVKPEAENAKKLRTALSEFGFGDAGIPWDEFEKSGAAISIGVQPNQIDLLTSVSDQPTDEVFENSEWGELSGRSMRIIALGDLIYAKEKAGRTKDVLDLEELGKA